MMQDLTPTGTTPDSALPRPDPSLEGVSNPVVDGMTPERWDAVLAGFDDASLYQTWAYGEVSWGESQLSHLVLERGGEVVGAAQVRLVRLPVVGKGVAYVRWGPLCRRRGRGWDAGLFRAAVEALVDEYVGRRGLLLRMIPNVYTSDPFADSARAVLAELGLVQEAEDPAYHTMRVDLAHPLDKLRMGLRPRWRNKLKHAESQGLTVTGGADDARYARFLEAYEQMMARKRFDTTVDVQEFATLQSRLSAGHKFHVLLCEREGRLLNALVIAPGGDSGIYLLAATSDAGLEFDGAFLLQWHGFQFLKERGCRWYDLGGVNSERNPGVYQFKSGMGGEDVHQLGRFECRRDRASTVLVSSAERLSEWARRAAAFRFKKPAAAPAGPAGAADGASAPKDPPAENPATR